VPDGIFVTFESSAPDVPFAGAVISSPIILMVGPVILGDSALIVESLYRGPLVVNWFSSMRRDFNRGFGGAKTPAEG
jgi:hypothetical protein